VVVLNRGGVTTEIKKASQAFFVLCQNAFFAPPLLHLILSSLFGLGNLYVFSKYLFSFSYVSLRSVVSSSANSMPLLDSGASDNFVSSSLVSKLNLGTSPFKTKKLVHTANGSPLVPDSYVFLKLL